MKYLYYKVLAASITPVFLFGCGSQPPGVTPSPSPSATLSPTATASTPSPTESPSPLTPTPSPTASLGETPTPCGSPSGEPCPSALVITELMPRNDGAWVDEAGHADDWIEVENRGFVDLLLSDFSISDDADEAHPLPPLTLPPGEVLLLWADDEPEQGPTHLPFKLSGSGESVYLFDNKGARLQEVAFPELEEDVAWAFIDEGFEACRFPSPWRNNLSECALAPPLDLPEEVVFAPYTWPETWPTPPAELRLQEIDLWGTGKIEIINSGSGVISLGFLRMEVASIRPGQGMSGPYDGVNIPLPSVALAPGERALIQAPAAVLDRMASDFAFEGVVSIFDPGGEAMDQVDFSQWPEGSALTRFPEESGRFVYCQLTTLGEANDTCEPLQTRPVTSYLRHLRTPGDLEAFGIGDPKVGVAATKFVMDLDHGDQLFFLDSRVWDLHYTFVREVIEGEEHLDRCDPEEAQVFNAGWGAFSAENYYSVEGRSYILGTMSVHGTNDLHAVEYSTGDVIIAEQMSHAFFGATARVWEPERWSIRGQDDRQTAQLLSIDGQVPATPQDAPYEGMTYQPLNEGVAYGTLTYLPLSELESAALGPQVIVVTDGVPLDIPLVGGLITESFQSPLSHVAVLSRNRGTPNMAALEASKAPAIADTLGQLVKLTVASDTYRIEGATLPEAEAYWESLTGATEPAVPPLDLNTRGVLEVSDLGRDDTKTAGAKASLLGELMALSSLVKGTSAAFDTPEGALALPMAYYRDHMISSGAQATLEGLLEEERFFTDVTYRYAALRALQGAILDAPVDAALVETLEAALELRFGEERMRFRSSSNAEDIEGFTGAGLYTSVSVEFGDDDLGLEEGLRQVWASLWSPRAFDERLYYGIDQSQVAMGVLIHRAFIREKANGVAVTRNIYDPRRGSTYFINVQFGEASVVGPVPGVSADELLYRRGITPPESYLAHSSFLGGVPVLTKAEGAHLSEALKRINDTFRVLLDPTYSNPYFAMDVEFKLVGEERSLMIKQARPYSFGRGVTGVCVD